MSQRINPKIQRFDKRLISTRVGEEFQQAIAQTEQQPVPHWSMNQHDHRQELTRIIHDAICGAKVTKVQPMKPYVIDAILEVSVHRARLIRTKHREEQQVKRLDKKHISAVWREVSQWVTGSHKRPTHVDLDTLGFFKSKIHHTPEVTNVYQRYWEQAFQASAKAGRAEVALKGHQRIEKVNLKDAPKEYLDQLLQQAAVMSVDWWWDKLKPLRVKTKGKKVPPFLKPIPELIHEFGMPFPTAGHAADVWVQAFHKIAGGDVTTSSKSWT